MIEFLNAFRALDRTEKGFVSTHDLDEYIKQNKTREFFKKNFLELFDIEGKGYVTYKDYCKRLGLLQDDCNVILNNHRQLQSKIHDSFGQILMRSTKTFNISSTGAVVEKQKEETPTLNLSNIGCIVSRAVTMKKEDLAIHDIEIKQVIREKEIITKQAFKKNSNNRAQMNINLKNRSGCKHHGKCFHCSHCSCNQGISSQHRSSSMIFNKFENNHNRRIVSKSMQNLSSDDFQTIDVEPLQTSTVKDILLKYNTFCKYENHKKNKVATQWKSSDDLYLSTLLHNGDFYNLADEPFSTELFKVFKLTNKALEENSVDSEVVAIELKRSLDRQLGRAWHVVCGPGPFGSNVASLPGVLAHFRFRGWAFLIWKTPDEFH